MEIRPSFYDSLHADIQPSYTDSLMHFGIKGQKWGVRRFEDSSGHLTPAGKRRYENDDGTLNDKGRKRYVKRMARDMEDHFMNQLPDHVKKTVRLGRNGYDVRGESWNAAYRKGLVTHKDDVLIRKAAANSRAYAKEKYGESAFKAMQRSGGLFKPVDKFDVKTVDFY